MSCEFQDERNKLRDFECECWAHSGSGVCWNSGQKFRECVWIGSHFPSWQGTKDMHELTHALPWTCVLPLHDSDRECCVYRLKMRWDALLSKVHFILDEIIMGGMVRAPHQHTQAVTMCKPGYNCLNVSFLPYQSRGTHHHCLGARDQHQRGNSSRRGPGNAWTGSEAVVWKYDEEGHVVGALHS